MFGVINYDNFNKNFTSHKSLKKRPEILYMKPLLKENKF